jgi:hypothetical protein
MKGMGAEESEQHKDEGASTNPNQPGSKDKVNGIDGSYELMLDAFTPDIIEQYVGDIDLTDVDNTHGDYPDENKGHHIGAELEIGSQQTYGKKTYGGPKEDLEEAEDVAFRDHHILENKREGFRPFTSKTQGKPPLNLSRKS